MSLSERRTIEQTDKVYILDYGSRMLIVDKTKGCPYFEKTIGPRNRDWFLGKYMELTLQHTKPDTEECWLTWNQCLLRLYRLVKKQHEL